MVEIRFDKRVKVLFSKIKDNLLKEKIMKQIKKISENPEVGKPMRNVRKETRELYVKPFRLSYYYLKNENVVYILDLYHKDKQ
ncbi:MAG: type II toxin-antitoxin system RelE/ParE family toxin [Candidatus Pacearchaeota archaeon]|nr:type II toxin-antitoxin system RelE/ParE family toxin [Candidatus Pacearchaeota archaeon]